MRITVMCAVPFKRIDGGPTCTDGRGGQIYHQATPGFFVKSTSRFSVGVAVSFLLEYAPGDIEVSHLEYVIGTARMSGEIIGTTRNDFVLNPYSPQSFKSTTEHLATYENIPLSIECSSDDFGLIELSWALKVDTHTDPIEVSQAVFVRIWTHPDIEDALSSEEYDAWQRKTLRTAKRSNESAVASLLNFISNPSAWYRKVSMRRS